MRRIRNSQWYLVTLQIQSDEWNYSKSQEVVIPVKSWSEYHVQEKIYNRLQGSEYPSYRIISVEKCDSFLMKDLGQ
jgi:hypothetical protein